VLLVPPVLEVLLVVLPEFDGAEPLPRHAEAGPPEREEGGTDTGVHPPGPTFGAETRGSDVVPDDVAIWAEVALALPGHQVMNHPSATVATTSWPSSRARVTPVTPDWVLPSTSV
jgi:hypothetical protein